MRKKAKKQAKMLKKDDIPASSHSALIETENNNKMESKEKSF